MDSKELRAVLTKPQIARLKQMTDGLEVGQVMGARILVKLVVPYTEMDRLEKEGLLVMPETGKEANTPLPTTGVVVAVGPKCETIGEGAMVMFSKFAGSDCFFNNEQFRVMEEKEVLCTLKETNPAGPSSVVPVAE